MDLSDKFAQKVVEAFKKDGLLCSIEWLKTGGGNPPESLDALSNKIETPKVLPEDEERAIFMESTSFKKLNKDSIVMTFPYNDMFNEFKMGDSIGGIKIKGNLDKFFGKKVIARLKDGMTWVGFLSKGSKENSFSIVPFNLQDGTSVLHDANIEEVFEIIWHRKRRL